MKAGMATAAGLMVWLHLAGAPALGLETVNLALPTKSFQQVIYPLAQERGYMREEGSDFSFALESDRQLTRSGWRP